MLLIIFFIFITYSIFTKNKNKEYVLIVDDNEIKDTVFVASSIRINGDTIIHGACRIYKYAPDTFNIYLKPSEGVVLFETKIEGETK